MAPKLSSVKHQELVSIIEPGSNLSILPEQAWVQVLQHATESAHYAGTRSGSRFCGA